MNQKEALNTHAGHRQRMRRKLLEKGADSLSDYELLEMLLYYAIPLRDTMPMAADLLNTFGSLTDVLDASQDELMQIHGVGENTAVLLRLLPIVARRYSAIDTGRISFSCTERAHIIRFLSVQYLGVTKEGMLMLTFNARGEFVRCFDLGDGEDVSHVDVYRRRLAQATVSSHASTVILSHIHPGGVAAPSANDVLSTRAARDVLTSLGVRLQDHVIFSNEDEYIFLSDLPAYANLFL